MAEICSLNASYNIVVLLTDERTIDSRANKQPGPMSTSLEFLVRVLKEISGGDLWLVHLTQQYPTRYQDFVTETLFINNAKMALSVDDILSFYVPGKAIHESDMKRCNESLTKFAAKKFMQKYLRENVSTVNHKGDLLVPLEKVHDSTFTSLTPLTIFGNAFLTLELFSRCQTFNCNALLVNDCAYQQTTERCTLRYFACIFSRLRH
jgi:hypothetical protein